ncbi:hypothetical protein ACS0TY_026842 [Phlomoides rotata]
MKERRVLFCKIHCPFMCFCKPSAAHLYTSGPLKLENTPQIVVPSSAAYAVCNNSTSEVKVECVGETNTVLKSCMRKPPCRPNSTKEVEQKKKKRVQWMDDYGKQLAEIKVFESSETGDNDNEDESNRCFCVIL